MNLSAASRSGRGRGRGRGYHEQHKPEKTMPRWYDKAVDEIEKEYSEGGMSYEEFREAMRDIDAELKEAAEDAANDARENYYNQW